jgi:hypothetical protein
MSFDRVDRIGLTVVLVLAAVLAAVTWIVGPVLAWANGDDLLVPHAGAVSVPALDAAGIGYSEAEYLIRVADAPAGQWLLRLLPGLGFTAVVGAGAWLLVRVIRDIGREEPFTLANVRRLRALGLLMLVAWPVLTLVQSAVDSLTIARLDVEGIGAGLHFTLPVVVMVAGMVVGLVAEAFAAGARLRADVDGLV